MTFFETVVTCLLMVVFGYLAAKRCMLCFLVSLLAVALLVAGIKIALFLFLGLAMGACASR